MPSYKDIKAPTLTITWLADNFRGYEDDPEIESDIRSLIGVPAEIASISYCVYIMSITIRGPHYFMTLYADTMAGIIDFGDGHTITIDRPEA